MQGADSFRVIAYRRAREILLTLRQDIVEVFERGGREALEAIPGIGASISAAITEMVTTGRWRFLEHLRGAAEPEDLFRSVPGLGPKLARRACEHLHIGTLADLETAAHDGRLERVPGFGRRRAAIVRSVLAEMLGRVRSQRTPRDAEPTADMLLDVDREYRRRATSGDLIKIAPRRFNPDRAAWLPVLHTVRDGWHFTAIHSNTARAHRLGRTGDWVIIYFPTGGWPEGQRTIVTERRGEHAMRRVVRGREAECPAVIAAA